MERIFFLVAALFLLVAGCQPKPRVETLGPQQVKNTFSTVLADVKACHDEYRQPGIVDIRFTVAGMTGRVVEALVVGDFQETPTGTCIQKIVLDLEFPPFKKRFQRQSYSIILK